MNTKEEMEGDHKRGPLMGGSRERALVRARVAGPGGPREREREVASMASPFFNI